MNEKKSTITKFYRKTIQERQDIVKLWIKGKHELTQDLSLEQANEMTENVIGTFSLPFSIATNFLINGNDAIIPMAIEEPSVIAAVSNAAKIIRRGGGFTTSSDPSLMIGQIQLLDLTNPQQVAEIIKQYKTQIISTANQVGGSIIQLGGGAKDIEIIVHENTRIGDMIIVHLLYDTRDAMGANAVNTASELVAPLLEQITGARANLRILSNLSDKRKAYAKVKITPQDIEKPNSSGHTLIERIVEAAVFAEVDVHRATTHNKGIMNGIDAVAIATGNDWRAIEAGAHAFAARHGHYTSLTTWRKDNNGDLHGSIEIPMAVGIVGGATRVHPKAQLAIEILGVHSARELAEIMAAVGLAQNFAALMALSSDGIQKGHMKMHARQLASAAGALPHHVSEIAQQMIDENNIRLQRAKELVNKLTKSRDDNERNSNA